MSTNDHQAPKVINSTSIEGPFGSRPIDRYILDRPKPTSRMICLTALLTFLVSGFLWLKLNRGAIGRIQPGEVKMSLEILSGNKILVPPLVVRIKVPDMESRERYKPTKIGVVSFFSQEEVPPGAEARATLLTGATNGLIKARLIEALKVDGISFLDAGTLLIGEGQSSEERLFISFKKAVFKNGKFISVLAQGYDKSDKILGLKGSRVGDHSIKLAASAGLNFIAGMAQGLQPTSVLMPGQTRRPSASGAALNGLSNAATEQGKQYLEDIKQRAPIIEVPLGTEFIVTFDGGGN